MGTANWKNDFVVNLTITHPFGDLISGRLVTLPYLLIQIVYHTLGICVF